MLKIHLLSASGVGRNIAIIGCNMYIILRINQNPAISRRISLAVFFKNRIFGNRLKKQQSILTPHTHTLRVIGVEASKPNAKIGADHDCNSIPIQILRGVTMRFCKRYSCFAKIFNTRSTDVINDCQVYFHFDAISDIITKQKQNS